MMARSILARSLLLLLACAASVLGTHFRGGIIMVRPHSGGEQNEMEVFFHVSWRRSHGPSGYCDQSTINSGTFIGSGDLVCQYGCSDIVTSMAYRCTDFSEEEDWSFGENHITYTFSGGPVITIGFTGGEWIHPFETHWNISTAFSTTRRNDTGQINSTPRAITAPVLRIQAGCRNIIRIPTYDPDHDIIRCRWAEGAECGGICSAFPGAVLDSASCSISYNAIDATGYQAAAIVIEDFVPGNTTPLSSVGLQFLVWLFRTSLPCSAMPEFIPPTIVHGACIAIPPGETFHSSIVVNSGGPGFTITEIQTVSPVGLEKSELFHVQDSSVYHVNVTWVPEASQQMDTHLFCYSATNSAGLSSSQVCIELFPGLTAPVPLHATATPNGEVLYPTNTSFQITFDQSVMRPLTSGAYITFHEVDTELEVYRIDTTSFGEVRFESTNQIVITPDFAFDDKKWFYINFDRGVVRGLEGCRPSNEPLTNDTFWVFETLDITPPIISFVESPHVSNTNISISWESDEPTVWQCKLVVNGAQQLEVNCSDGSWNGRNLSGGMYQLIVVGTDELGNSAEAVHAFTVDLTPPNASITRNPGEFSNQHTVLFRFDCNEICTFECTFTIKGNGTLTDTSLCNTRQYTTPPLNHGSRYTFSVTATDQVGNIGAPTSHTWEVDFEDPILFGVTNDTRADCTGNASPEINGQAQGLDNTETLVAITYDDQKTGCVLTRMWRGTDEAGNVGYLTQLIALDYSHALNMLPLVSVACDSSTGAIPVPTSTATLQNPCGRPLSLVYQDSVSEYTCPIFFSRLWNITDGCDQTTSTFDQSISLYDLCPPSACGRSHLPPHGECIQGSCSCNQPWYGQNCNILSYMPQVEPVSDRVLQEFEDYIEGLLLVEGTPPLTWTLLSAPDRLTMSLLNGDITWRRAQAGNYTVNVEVSNLAGKVTTQWSLYVMPGYYAVLDPPSQNLFTLSTPVQLTGHVEYNEGNIARDFLAGIVPVRIDVTRRGTVRVIETYTNQDGTFIAGFYPAGTEYGTYTAGARHPSTSRAADQISWDVLGMQATPRVVRLRSATVSEFRETFHDVAVLKNDGPQILHGVTVTASIGNIQGLSAVVTVNGSSTLHPGDSIDMDIHIETTGAFSAQFPIKIQTNEGVVRYITVDLSISQILPHLVSNPSSVNTRVVRGTFKTLEFTVTNEGSIPAHGVRAILPTSDFLSFVSFGTSQQQAEEGFTLGSGESAVLSVLVTIPPEQPLGDISGQIVISSIETYRRIYFNILVSSNVQMNFTVIVEDEYTYFAEGQPLVSDALVQLENRQRGIRTTLTTEERNGTVTFLNITEDRYNLHVNSPRHVPINEIIITSIESPVYTIFLARRAVTYTWTVVPTTFEETYTVTLETDFETHVPIPVVAITPTRVMLEPYELGYEDTIQFNITNHGLIGVEDVRLELPDGHPFLEFTTDIEEFGNLEPLASIIVPVRVTRSEDREKRYLQYTFNVLYGLNVLFNFLCGDWQTRIARAILQGQGVREVEDPRPVPVIEPMPWGGWQGGGGGGGNTIRPSLTSQPFTALTNIICNKCLLAVLGCVPAPKFPGSACLPILAAGKAPSSPLDTYAWLSCAFSIAGIPDIIKPKSGKNFADTWGGRGCIVSVIQDCALQQPNPEDGSGSGNLLLAEDIDLFTGLRKRDLDSTVRNMVEAFIPTYLTMVLGVEVLGDQVWIDIEDPTWLSQVLRPTVSDDSDMGTLISTAELSTILSFPPPDGTTLEMVQKMVERVNNTLYSWNNGILEPTDVADIASYVSVMNLTKEISRYNDRLKDKGYSSFVEAYNEAADQYNMIEDFEEDGVCAVVKIRIEQEIALTREAFLAKLEVENQEATSLEEMNLEIQITDLISGIEATQLFSISDEELSGSLTSSEEGWTLPSGGSGATEWLIVPYSEAAPTEDHSYNVGGVLSYIVSGEIITIPLIPTGITVLPDPSLRVHYFWEKYVTGDNPLTDETEPSVPFQLGVVIQNAGFGVASNVRITSGQPEIIDSEKGLLVTFRIIGVSIGSESINPSLMVEFGDILANTTKVARWWLISSAQGEFTNYSATFQYENPLGDPRLSVLDELEIHELIKSVCIYLNDTDDGVLDFLVNDVKDFLNVPDALYGSRNFERYNVSTGEILSVKTIDYEGFESQEVLAFSNSTGWVYFKYKDTQHVFTRTARAINATKLHDDQTIEIPEENVWITQDSQQSSASRYLHILDYIDTPGGMVFTLNPCIHDCQVDEQPFERPTPPVPPIDLEVNSVGSSWISISWEQVPTSRNISDQIILVSGGGVEQNVTVDGNDTSANLTGLQSGVQYTLRVLTVTVDGLTSTPSVAVTVKTLLPGPVNLQLMGAGSSWITLSWQQSFTTVNIISHIILVSGGGIEWNVTVEGGQNEANVTGLQPGTEYTLRVIAVVTGGRRTAPSDALVTATLGAAITTPEDVQVDSVGSSWITISWKNPLAAPAYYVVTISDGGAAINIAVEGSETSVKVTGLQPATEYALKVIAVAVNGQMSPPSDAVKATTLLPAPQPPEGLVVDNFGYTWVTVSWQQSVPIPAYYVIMVNEGGMTSNITVGSRTSANVTGLQPGTEYTLRVVAVATDGQMSPLSDALVVRTPIPAPQPPQGVAVDTLGTSWIALSWQQSVPIPMNYIIRATSERMRRYVTVEGNETSANVTGLQPGTEYTLRVIAVATDGQMSLSSDAIEVTTLFPAPQAPEGLVVDSFASSWIAVSWEQSLPIPALHIVLVSGGATTTNVTVEGDETVANVTGLQPGTEYTLTVIAVATDGQMSPPSDDLVVITPIPAPQPPQGVAVDTLGTSWITLSWQQSVPIPMNYIIRATSERMRRYVIVEGNETSANITGLQPGTEYTLRVIAVATDGQMSPSSDAIEAPTLLPAPEALVVDITGSSWIALSWHQSVPVPLYYVIMGEGGGTTSNFTVEGSETSANVTGLQPGTEYTLRVVAVATDGQMSCPSDAVVVATLWQVPEAPEGLVVDTSGSSWIALSWQQTIPNPAYYVVLIEEGNTLTTRAVVEGNETSANVTGLQPGTEYTLRVVAVDEHIIMSPLSDEVVVRTDDDLMLGIKAPQNLVVESFGSNWISISWQRVPSNINISTYIVIFGPTGQDVLDISCRTTGNETSTVMTELQSDTEYTLRVIAVAEDGETSAPSGAVTAVTVVPALDVFFINNTPRIHGGGSGRLYAELTANRPNVQLLCHFKGFDTHTNDCSNGTYTRIDIPPGQYTLRVAAKDLPTGDRKVINLAFTVSANEQHCATHLINRGSRVEEQSYIVEFSSTGTPTGFTCTFDQEQFECTTPLTLSDLPPGRHRIIVTPVGCSRFRHWREVFDIEQALRVTSVAVDGQINSPSDATIVTTLASGLQAPQGLVIEGFGSTWIALSWQTVARNVNISTYIVILSTAGQDALEISCRTTNTGNETSETVTELQPDTEYTLRVIAVAANGEMSAPSSAVTETTSQPEFDVSFINNTPRIRGGRSGSLYAELMANRPNIQLQCRFKGFDTHTDDCSNGTYTRSDIPPGRYTLRVVAKHLPTGDRKVINLVFTLSADEQHCATHLINRGSRVEGQSYIVEFSSTGTPTGFTCTFDSEEFDCASPLTLSDLDEGRHRIIVTPAGCRRSRQWREIFYIET